jgi:hypothetical protein
MGKGTGPGRPVSSGCKPAQPTTEALTRNPCRNPWAGGPLLYPCDVVGPALEPILTGPMGVNVPPTRSHAELQGFIPLFMLRSGEDGSQICSRRHTLHVRGY